MTTHALRQALVQHEAFVHELALVLTRNPAEADDVAQEVLLRTLERGPRAGGGLRVWLASSTRRVAWNLRRAERRRTAREQRAARPEALLDPTAALAARQQLVDAVLNLDEPFRRTIILVHERGRSLTERWRQFGERHGVAVLWTAGALEIDAQRSAAIQSGAPLDERKWALRFDVLGGSLLIRTADEPSSAQSLTTALFDLRLVLTGSEATRAQVERHPALARFAENDQPFTLALQSFEDLLRTGIAPGSWDEDLRTHAMLSRCPTLIVRHAPWVIDEIEALITALR